MTTPDRPLRVGLIQMRCEKAAIDENLATIERGQRPALVVGLDEGDEHVWPPKRHVDAHLLGAADQREEPVIGDTDFDTCHLGGGPPPVHFTRRGPIIGGGEVDPESQHWSV